MWCLNRMPGLISLNLNERFCMIRQIKLTLGRRHSSFSSTPSPMNFLSLKFDFVYLKFYWSGHTVLIIFRYEQTVLFKHIFKIFWFIDKNTAKVILVWNFDLRIFSVYGHGATSTLTSPWWVNFYKPRGPSVLMASSKSGIESHRTGMTPAMWPCSLSLASS